MRSPNSIKKKPPYNTTKRGDCTLIRVIAPFSFTEILCYRFMLISVSSISSETVMIFEFDWNPRCVMIMSEN